MVVYNEHICLSIYSLSQYDNSVMFDTDNHNNHGGDLTNLLTVITIDCGS